MIDFKENIQGEDDAVSMNSKKVNPEVNDKMELQEKRLIEAVLFISGRDITIEELRKITGIAALGYLQKLTHELQKEYNERGSAIEIVELNGKFSMKIKNEYVDKVRQFAQESEITKPALRTLAYISKHDGVLKSELAKRIGSQIYEDIKELIENDFVKTQKAGRSAKIFITDKFKKYFQQ